MFPVHTILKLFVIVHAHQKSHFKVYAGIITLYSSPVCCIKII